MEKVIQGWIDIDDDYDDNDDGSEPPCGGKWVVRDSCRKGLELGRC